MEKSKRLAVNETSLSKAPLILKQHSMRISVQAQKHSKNKNSNSGDPDGDGMMG